MKNLSVMMTVKATNPTKAEEISMSALMDMAKLLAKKSGASMAGGSGNANRLSDGVYHVDAKMFIDGSIEKDDIMAIQSAWMDKAEIVNSMILVEDETETMAATETKQPITRSCDVCGQMMTYDANKVRNKDGVWDICDECIEGLLNDGEIVVCESCDEMFFYDCQHLNPVTGEANICPCCGHTN